MIFMPAKGNSTSLFDKLPPMKMPKFNFEVSSLMFPAIDLSPQFLMSLVVFFILGFIMILGTIRNKQAGI